MGTTPHWIEFLKQANMKTNNGFNKSGKDSTDVIKMSNEIDVLYEEIRQAFDDKPRASEFIPYNDPVFDFDDSPRTSKHIPVTPPFEKKPMHNRTSEFIPQTTFTETELLGDETSEFIPKSVPPAMPEMSGRTSEFIPYTEEDRLASLDRALEIELSNRRIRQATNEEVADAMETQIDEMLQGVDLEQFSITPEISDYIEAKQQKSESLRTGGSGDIQQDLQDAKELTDFAADAYANIAEQQENKRLTAANIKQAEVIGIEDTIDVSNIPDFNANDDFDIDEGILEQEIPMEELNMSSKKEVEVEIEIKDDEEDE
jgi:hypothetical protein